MDASHCPETKAAGWACWIRYDGTYYIKKTGTFKRKPKHSTEAELWACLNSIHIAMHYGLLKYGEPLTKILLQNDCEGVIAQLNTKSFIKKYLDNKTYLEARHVRGHTSRHEARFWCNRWCDRYAKIEMRKQRSKNGYYRR